MGSDRTVGLAVLVAGISRSVAEAGARELLGAGIGTELIEDGPDSWTMWVVPTDRARAAELLGLPAERPEEGATAVGVEGDGDGPGTGLGAHTARFRRPAWTIVLAFVVALAVIPYLAFQLTVKVLGGDCPSGPDVPVSVIMTTRC